MRIRMKIISAQHRKPNPLNLHREFYTVEERWHRQIAKKVFAFSCFVGPKISYSA